MKRLSLLGSLVLAVLAMLTYTSCEETPGGGPGPSENPPIVELVGGAGFVTGDVEESPGATISLNVTGLSGDADMQSLEILEDGVTLTDYATRVSVNGTAAWANPILLQGADATSFDYIIDLVVQNDESLRTYTIEVTDVSGNKDAVSFDVNTVVAYPGPFSLSLVETTPYIWTDATVEAGSYFKVGLTAVRDNAGGVLWSLGVAEDGVNIADLTRLRYNSLEFGANPSGIPTEDENGFTAEVQVQAHLEDGVTKNYTFTLENEMGDQVSVSLNISTPVTGTPLDQSLTGILLNSAGPVGTGGLDLDTGTGTGSNDPLAEIKDNGIDLALPNATNWKQTISPTNNATLRVQSASPELQLDFDNALYKEEIQDAYNNGSDISTSNVVNIGDVFLVQRDGVYYAIKCTNVNITAADNADSYTFSIKW
jgi:hypothetical protein